MATVTSRQQTTGERVLLRVDVAAFALPLMQESKTQADAQATQAAAITSMTTIQQAVQYVDPR